jgi:hypothetical protein
MTATAHTPYPSTQSGFGAEELYLSSEISATKLWDHWGGAQLSEGTLRSALREARLTRERRPSSRTWDGSLPVIRSLRHLGGEINVRLHS